MKKTTTSLLLLITSCLISYGQTFDRIKYTVNPDSILLENKPTFSRFKYDGDQYQEEDAVKFTLKITNMGTEKIPDIQTARFKGTLRIFVNGKPAMEMSLANGMFGEDVTLAKNGTDLFDMDMQISGPNAIDYGDEFTWQWEYMGILSKIMQVNLKKKTIKEVEKHIKNDKAIY